MFSLESRRMRPTTGTLRHRYPVIVACALLGLLAGCNNGPALNLATHDINQAGGPMPAGASMTRLPLPEPVLSPAQQRDAALATFLEAEQVEEVPSYRYAAADLDGDGGDELLLLLEDPNWCGSGGCSLLVFHGEGEDGYRLVTRTRVTRAPIRLSPQRHNGWHDLLVGVGGGGTQAGTVALQFDGDGYPDNPTLLALLADGTMPRAQMLIE